MNQLESANWLLANGGPAIRYRTATELMPPSSSVDITQLREDLLQSELVRAWIDRLTPSAGFNDLHGSKATAFENAMGKLTQLGCRRGVPELDQRTMSYRSWLKDTAERPHRNIFDVFARTLIAAFLARAGYSDEPAVGMVLRNRLETVYDYARQGRYDIHVSTEGLPQVPPNWRDVPLIDPTLSEKGNLCLPWIYDIVGLAAYLPECGTEDDWSKTDTVINYILNDQYQRLPDGYGTLIGENRRYYAMGWSVHLPGYFGNASKGAAVREFVQRLTLMACFPAATQHPWFGESLRHLRRFQTERGTYLFPRPYLEDGGTGYWIAGRRMGLEEKRRATHAIELESTFWMTALKASISTERDV